jgi:hypothetical protein
MITTVLIHAVATIIIIIVIGGGSGTSMSVVVFICIHDFCVFNGNVRHD